MFKKRSAILILISAFLVGGGYLNSEAINTYFSYVTEKFDPVEPVLEVYFSQTPEALSDPNFTTAQIKEPSSDTPPYYLIINTNSARETIVSFSPFTVPSYPDAGSIPYTVSMHEFKNNQSSDEPIGSCDISSTSGSGTITMYGPDMTFGKPVRYVYSFIYKFDEADISNASPETYESTVTVTVNGG